MRHCLSSVLWILYILFGRNVIFSLKFCKRKFSCLLFLEVKGYLTWQGLTALLYNLIYQIKSYVSQLKIACRIFILIFVSSFIFNSAASHKNIVPVFDFKIYVSMNEIRNLQIWHVMQNHTLESCIHNERLRYSFSHWLARHIQRDWQQQTQLTSTGGNRV